MASNSAEYNRIYARNRRVKLRKQGICTMCASRRPRKGYKICNPCIEQAARRANRKPVENLVTE